MPTLEERCATSEAVLAAQQKTIDAQQGAIDGLRRRMDLTEEALHDAVNGSDDKPGIYTRLRELERKEKFVSAIVKWLFVAMGGLGISWLSNLIPWGHNQHPPVPPANLG